MLKTFKTERLVCRITNADDLEALCACQNTPDMNGAIYFFTYPCTFDEGRKWIARAEKGLETQTEWLFSVFLMDSKTYIGNINLHKTKDGEGEIGYWICPGYRGQGFASEMSRGIVKFGFSNLGFERIFATTALDNLASQKILKKAGFDYIEEKTINTPKGPRVSKFFEVRKS
jgi:RimJ/RimL family protein N-acetyltransferase